MKIIRPYIPTSPKIRGGRKAPTRTPPQWLQEYIDNQGQYVLLSCGHKTDLNGRSVIAVVKAFTGTQVLCSICDDFKAVDRQITMSEYFDIPKRVDSEFPLF